MNAKERARISTAIQLLAEMLYGITAARPNHAGEDTPDVGLDAIGSDADTGQVSADVHVASGDVFRVTVQWVGDEEGGSV